MRWLRTVSFILLYGLYVYFLISRIYLIFFIDSGAIFGDVTFLVMQVVVLLQYQRYVLFLVTAVGVFIFGYLVAEWANFT